MDALTNVVGILLLILIVLSLQITTAVKKIVENLPEVTQEELEAMRVSRDNTLKNLEELKQTHTQTTENLPTPEEAATLVAELEEFEKNNADLADKTSDIEEWQAKVTEQEEKKIENDEKVRVADERNRELAAILAQTPEAEVKAAKEIVMPNPRISEPDDRALYFICKFGRLYFVGDPYDHALKIRDVIDQNFTDLAFTGKAIGSYTYPLKITRKNENDQYLSLTEDYRLSRREREALAAWEKLTPKWTNREGVEAKDANVVDRIFGAAEEAELPVFKFRYDLKKIMDFFGDGKLGPKDFAYHVSAGAGDRIKMGLAPKEDGGWTEDQFLATGSQFEQYCKQASTARRVLFYFFVAPDSFETYLQARAKSEEFRVPAGWTVWNGDKLEPKAVPARLTDRYNLDVIPDAEYMKLANVVGPYMVEELNLEFTEFAQRVEASVPAETTDPAERKKFIDTLTIERRDWNATRFQNYMIDIFKAPLAAEEASGEKEVVMEIVPPEIPHIRIFQPSRPPAAPTPPPEDRPKPKPTPTGTGTLILD